MFQKLKDAKKNPVFMLKHIKDIRSPIAVAQQKQAARKASGAEGTVSAKSAPSAHGSLQSQSPAVQDTRNRPPKLQVNSQLKANPTPGLLTAIPNGQAGWPELMSPMIEQKHGDDGGPDTAKPDGPEASSYVAREMPPATEVSFAVAIYPYMAEQDDEFDVVV